MTAMDMRALIGWFPAAMNALLLLSAAAIAANVRAGRRRALRVPIDVRVPATVAAIVGRSPSVPAMAGQAPSDTSIPEAA